VHPSGIDKVAREWVCDRHCTRFDAHPPKYAHQWSHPSHYKPAASQRDEVGLVDYIKLPRPAL
jgi:hypothetical protein